MLLDVATEHATFWWITLGLGFVVILVVIVLLSLLVALVRDIDRNVLETWRTATTFAQNTATTWMLNQTGTLTEDLVQEVERHNAMLAGGVR